MTRYDHRDAEARAADTQEHAVIDGPLMAGAVALQAAAKRSLAALDVAHEGR
jgi:hypothetical protein